MNNKINVRSFSIASLFLFAFIYSLSAPQQAHAQTPCYTFTPSTGSTVSVKITPSSGIPQTITIPNQNPPSILHPISFTAANSGCALWFYNGQSDILYSNFLVSTGKIPLNGTPENLNLPTAFTSSNGIPFGFLGQINYFGLSDIGQNKTTENAIISTIESTHQFSINAGDNQGNSVNMPFSSGVSYGGGYPYGPLTMTAPATNCVALGGTGPRKVVFMRGQSWSSNVSDLIYQAQNVINNGYKVIDPYKTYINQFSFYADLNNYNDSSGGLVNVSACGTASQTIFFMNNTQSGSFAASGLNNALTYYNFGAEAANISFYAKDAGVSTDVARAGVIIHETGHAFAGLLDEYVLTSNQTGGTNPNLHTIDNVSANNLNGLGNTENCTGNPSQAYRYSNSANPTYDGRLFGGYLNVGCTYLMTATIPSGMKRPAAYYRPSTISIMNGATGIPGTAGWTTKFNIISCGYIVAAIQGQALTKTNAQSHWLPTDPTSPNGKGCYALDTTGHSEIPAIKPAPTTTGFIPATGGTTGGTINGSGFTPTGNSIKLTPKTTTSVVPSTKMEANTFSAFDFITDFIKNLIPVAHGQTASTFYEINDISSPDGTSLNFTVPSDTPDGTYTISVSALNSPWAATSHTIVVSGNGAGNPSTGTTDPATTGTPGTPPSIPLGTYPASAPADAVYTCPSGYTLTGSTCYKAAVTTSVPASSYGASLGCPSNAPFFNASMNSCQGTYNGLPLTAARTYTCPSGGTLSGSTCTIPAANNVSPASTVAATAKYSCPTGYTLASATCTINNKPIDVTAKATGNGQVVLTWNNNNVPKSRVVCIERALGNATTFTPVYTPQGLCFTLVGGASGLSPTTYTDTGLAPAQSYQYRMYMSIDNTVGGNGPYTTPVKVTTASAPTAPTLKATAASASSINLTWTSSEQNIVGYGIYLVSSTQKTFVATSTTKSATVSGLSAGTQYCYGVIASVNLINNSAISKNACATTTGTAVTTPEVPVSTPATTTPVTPTTPVNEPTLPTTPVTPTTPGVVNATPTYTCPTGQILDTVTKRCARRGSNLSTTASVTYSCPTGYTLNLSAKTCTPPAAPTNTPVVTTPPPVVSTPTPTPVVPTPVVNTPPPVITTPVVTTIPATKKYSCLSNLVLNEAAGTCSRGSRGAETTATVKYSCPSGYILNSVNHTCSMVVSFQVATSSTTASVWNAMMNWFSDLFY